MTEAAIPVLGKIEDVAERFGLFAISEVGLNALFSWQPWLGVWPLGPIIRGMTELLCSKLFKYIRLVIDLKIIKFTNERNQAAFDRSMVTLKAMARGYGIESEEFKTARENAKATFSDFVRFRGA